MEPTSVSQPSAAPRFAADQRPAADAAAKPREIRSDAPFGPPLPPAAPANTRQLAEVQKSLLQTSDQKVSAAREVSRTLKPYGMPMLPPERDAQNGQSGDPRGSDSSSSSEAARSPDADA